eukprot:Skav200118  [mRNA]  locus=scaffold3069:77107:77922:- [translate_table: standard]
MPKPTRAEMVTEMARLGGGPTRQWSCAEVMTRLNELRAENNLPPFGKAKQATPLRKEVIQPNAASKKRADLMNHVIQHLGVPCTGHETIDQLMQIGLLKIYQVTEPSSEDPVGFGKYATLSYQELKETQKDYAIWAMKTASENQSDYRLQRLATWLTQQNESNMGQESSPVIHALNSKEMAAAGYLPNGAKIKQEALKKEDVISMRSSGSGSVTSSQILQTQALISQLGEIVSDLREDVQEIKQELPRKGVKTESEQEKAPSSNGSFVRIK